MTAPPDEAPRGWRSDERCARDATTRDAVARAVDAFAHALRLSCLAARHPSAALANEAVSAHVAARAWAEEAVRRAERGTPGA